MDVRNIVVVGAGQMGSGIAQVCAQSGYHVVLHDINEDIVERGINSIHRLLTRAVEKGRITDIEKDGTLNRLTTSTDIGRAHDADLVIEAVIENLDVKKELFQQLDQVVAAHTILATNTSSLPITEIAAVTNRPGKVIGMHFMNPVPVMKLVEIIRAIQTDEETYLKIESVAKELNKTSVTVNDFPGFVANRILMPMINEAIYTVYEGVASPEDVDTVMKLGMNHPMGPLTLADFIGLDTCLYIMEVLYEGFGDSKYRPCPLLRQYVQAGWYGKKTGKGFYTYT
ncbi:3-hydroxybutyryl-CoA dehydrogenase [Pseudogracilibacillus sp. SE30717A]|uniref:3-hydroxybutyryl-CoA dehydrogenase n=1 Tax=Pseudogracilibacillus sp. SE30717A TaxID=3098293 RepID=UPI00300E29DB